MATTLSVVDDGAVEGYTSSSYGDAFADVYDDWYRDVSDIAATVSTVAELAAGGQVLELGIGTGRLAIPLAAHGCSVTGVDSSPKMLAQLAVNDPDGTVVGVLGDMVDDLPDGPFAVVLVAYNTLFNLLSAERQQACLSRVAQVLTPDGCLVVEAIVPHPHHGSQVSVRTLSADRVVLSVSVHDAAGQRAEGQFVELTEAGGVRLRPWSIRYSTPDELDDMAARAGLARRYRWGGFDRCEFGDDSALHVSVYTRQSDT
jgi:SAM-dependent methyltransferase